MDGGECPFEFDAIVVDELSSFKNWNSKRFKSLMKVRPRAKRVIGLTGTPSGNGLMDLFAEFKVLDMGQRLGRFITKYRQDYFRPDRMNGQMVYSYKPLPGAEKRIYDKISDITISMKAADHLKMPELVNSEYRVYMEEPEQAIYDEMCEDLAAQLDKGEVTAANAGVLSGKLSQMANGAVYTDNGDVEHIHDQKLDALEDIIESMNGKPLLVAYWYQHDLDRIDVWTVGRHRLVCGDATSAEDVAKLMEGRKPSYADQTSDTARSRNQSYSGCIRPSAGSSSCRRYKTPRILLQNRPLPHSSHPESGPASRCSPCISGWRPAPPWAGRFCNRWQ